MNTISIRLANSQFNKPSKKVTGTTFIHCV
jgi:hypothetical protein